MGKNIPIIWVYEKNGSNWAMELLNGDSATIGMEGCAVASMADLAATVGQKLDPLSINKLFVENGSVNWEKVGNALGLDFLGKETGQFSKEMFDQQDASMVNIY